jgi:hypothetical protein
VLSSRQLLNGSHDLNHIFSIIFVYFFKYETIATHARAFLALIISIVGSVLWNLFLLWYSGFYCDERKLPEFFKYLGWCRFWYGCSSCKHAIGLKSLHGDYHRIDLKLWPILSNTVQNCNQ